MRFAPALPPSLDRCTARVRVDEDGQVFEKAYGRIVGIITRHDVLDLKNVGQ